MSFGQAEQVVGVVENTANRSIRQAQEGFCLPALLKKQYHIDKYA